MKELIDILIVDNHLDIAESLKSELSVKGFYILDIISGCEKVLEFMRKYKPDVVLMDVDIGEKPDGISTIKALRKEFNTPVIYITSLNDHKYFLRAKATNPSAYITRPFKLIDLQRAIELAFDNSNMENQQQEEGSGIINTGMPEFIYFKKADRMIKIRMRDIYYIEANRNYSRIFLEKSDLQVLMTLKSIDRKLPGQLFLRIHRSFVVNILRIDEIAPNHIRVGEKFLPLNKLSRPALMSRIFSV